MCTDNSTETAKFEEKRKKKKIFVFVSLVICCLLPVTCDLWPVSNLVLVYLKTAESTYIQRIFLRLVIVRGLVSIFIVRTYYCHGHDPKDWPWPSNTLLACSSACSQGENKLPHAQHTSDPQYFYGFLTS